MWLTLFGHAAVGLTAERTPWPGHRLLFDPYEPGGFGGKMAFPPIDFDPDDILVTHLHLDHCHTAPFPRARLTTPDTLPGGAPGLPEALALDSLEVDHDAFGGRTRGGTSHVLAVSVDGLRVVHLGDIGELPAPERLDGLTGGAPIDVLLLTCGGFFTVGPSEAAELALRLGARLVVPIHHADARCGLPHLHAGRETLRWARRVEEAPNPARLLPEGRPSDGTTWRMPPLAAPALSDDTDRTADPALSDDTARTAAPALSDDVERAAAPALEREPRG